MSTFAARLDRVDPGVVDIAVPFADRPTQQDGFLHALSSGRGDSYALTGDEERHVATILTTMFGVGDA